MIGDLSIVPGLLLLAAELLVLAAVGFVVVRVALGQTDDLLALAQGLVIGLGLWGMTSNLAMFVLPGMAGASVGWVATLAIGAGFAWRAASPIRPRPRAVAGLAAVALALFMLALAGRQLVPNPDPAIHHGLIATMRAGGTHPPEVPWNPGLVAPYHYGLDLLVGLLTPPSGPDPAFVTELLGAYLWTAYALIVGTLLLRRGSWLAVVALGPLLLAAGTEVARSFSPGVLELPVPAGIPAPGLRASLGTVFVDGLDSSASVPPNVWKPNFPLAYALALVVLERAAHCKDWDWARHAVLAVLVGFLGLVDEVVAPVVLVLWGLLEGIALLQAVRERPITLRLLRAAAGPALAVLLLAAGGGVITAALTGGPSGGISLSWIDHSIRRPSVASFQYLAGGVGVLGLGPFVVAGIALLLAPRNRLCLALTAGSLMLLAAALTLQYEYAQHDVSRLDGQSRNFALLAVLLALSPRLRDLRPRRRNAAAAMIVVLLTWPAVVAPVRALGTAVGGGVQIANAASDLPGRRQVFTQFSSERVATYIRDRTEVDARILSPRPTEMSSATGRPNASGFTQVVHYVHATGPEYLDAIRFLEPAAVRRLGIDYVHTTDAWIADLPERARHWINDPKLFERLATDEGDSLYRVRSAFLEIEATPTPKSYEALRRAVPPSAAVYLASTTDDVHALRLASALPHARMLGVLHPGPIHLRTDFGIKSPGDELPSLVVVPHWFTPSMFAPEYRQPVWWNDWVAIYSPDGAVGPVMSFTPPPSPPASVEVSGGELMDERVKLTVSLTTRDPDRWSGQDWIVIPMDSRIPAFPKFGGPASVL